MNNHGTCPFKCQPFRAIDYCTCNFYQGFIVECWPIIAINSSHGKANMVKLLFFFCLILWCKWLHVPNSIWSDELKEWWLAIVLRKLEEGGKIKVSSNNFW